MTTIYLMRHGLVHNPDEILYGRIPGFRLSDEGREQAAAAGRYLADQPLGAIYASPQQRAQETAGIVAANFDDLSVQTDVRLDETHSPFEGRPLTELIARDWDLYTGVGSDYDSPEDILTRMLDFFQTLRERHPDEPVVAVTHGDPVVFSFMHFKGIVSETLKDRLALIRHGIEDGYPATASITTIRFNGTGDIADVNYTRPY